MINWTQLYSQTHEFNEGAIAIASSFVGNVLGISVTTKPEYAQSRQIVGYLFQDSGGARKGFALYSGKDILLLPVPQTDGLIFFPTSYLSDSYTLNIVYTTVGNILESNTAPIPDQILGLPSKVSEIEIALEALQSNISSPSWDSVADKPLTFPPTAHNHEISEIAGLSAWQSETETAIETINGSIASQSTAISELTLDFAALELRVGSLEENPTSSGSISTNLLAANATLESNARYLATVANLVCTLPNAPAIGDLIRLSTGNFSFSIKHGNASQQVLNNNTLTVAGADNGIVLKPYSDVDLIFLGSSLWKTTYRARTINNFTPATVENTVSKKEYTAQAPTPSNGTMVSGLNNGIKSLGALTNGYLSNVTTGDLILTFADAIIIDQLRVCIGQANNGAGVNDPYAVRDITVFAGGTDSAENLGVYTFSNTSPAEETKTITPNTTPSSVFLLRVNSITPRMIGILELEVHGKSQTGGETTV